MPRRPAWLLALFLFAVVGCSTINLKGGSSGANWRGSDEAQIRDQPGWVKVNQSQDGKSIAVQGSVVPPR